MTITEQVLQLPKAEKLKVMEAIWEDLSKRESEFDSPAWHEKELEAARQKLDRGEIEILDWEDAKNRLKQ